MGVIDLDSPAPPSNPPRLSRRAALRTMMATTGTLALSWGSAPEREQPNDHPGLARGSFAGRVPGSGLVLLVAIDTAGVALAHVCDNAGAARWLAGDLRGGTLRLAGEGTRLTARAGPAAIAGVYAEGDRSYAVDLAPLRAGGLYTDEEGTATWIVLDDGSRHGSPTRGTALRVDRLSVKWGRFPASAHQYLRSAGRPAR